MPEESNEPGCARLPACVHRLTHNRVHDFQVLIMFGIFVLFDGHVGTPPMAWLLAATVLNILYKQTRLEQFRLNDEVWWSPKAACTNNSLLVADMDQQCPCILASTVSTCCCSLSRL
jgi:hypothetical protein